MFLIILLCLVEVMLGQPMYSVDEDDGTVVIMVLLSQGSTQTIMVTVSSNDITANGEVATAVYVRSCIPMCNITPVGVDYGQSGVTSYPVTFTPGSTMQSIMIPIINDNVIEGNENFSVAINPLSMLGVIVGTPNTSIITIIETTGKVVLLYMVQSVMYNVQKLL